MRAQRVAALVLIIGIAMGVSEVRAADEAHNSCVTCHAVLPDALGAPVEGMQHDIHAEKGLSCADCHGGDPTSMDAEVSMSLQNGFRSRWQ